MKRYIFLLLTLSVTVALEYRNDTWSPHREKRELLRRTKRRWVLSTIEIIEEEKPPYPKLATKLFNDQEHDYDLVYSISGHGVDEDPLGVFTINSETGEVFAHKPVDREEYPIFHIKFNVLDKRTGKVVDRQLSFDVEVIDINDNAPLFDEPLKKVVINENQEEGLLPISLSATDRDEEHTDNSKITMSIVSQEPAYPKFGLTEIKFSRNNQLNLVGCFDYDKVKEYKVLVKAQDHGTPVLSSTGTVLISIQDSNTHPPVFKKAKHEVEVMEMSENKVLLRLAVTDKDTPNTPGWRAKYTILKGNEAGHYMIETDPKTNEGILTIIKAKDFEVTTKTHLLIGVENEEPLFVCGSKGADVATGGPLLQTADVTVTVIDVNDAPVFTKAVTKIYEKEEEEPGKVLYIPTVTDVDSDPSKIRYKIAQDSAKWMNIDPKTGVVKSVQKLDRDSSHVNNSIYTVVVHAIDDGKPPMTGTGTLLIHLSDSNDNAPFLVSKETYMCGNKDQSVEIQAHDNDEAPFGGPFTFLLRGDTSLKKQWKLDPYIGEKATLVSIKPLPFGTYTVPLTIEDQQGKSADEDLQVVVCDCGSGKVCKGLKEKSSALGGAAIATLFAGILAFLLLLCLCLICQCKGEQHKPVYLQEDGNQTLIKYNEEGGSSAYKDVPPHVMSPISSYVAADAVKQASIPLTQMSPGFQHSEANGTLRNQGMGMRMDMDMDMGAYDLGMEGMEAQWNTRSTKISQTRSQKLMSSTKVSELIERRLGDQKEDQLDFPGYHPQLYAYEGTGSRCQSLDQLSLSNRGDELDFLQHLGPKFNTLDGICRQAIEEKKLKL
ncbi:hypothetical protein ANANG_G00223480 [Anguilla anguilla]|uniref:Cadherin domain-containing protein n=1 Tax=Anguilla anguilla TaxID=7936 RepID=A0A9D3LXY3_ANGAN|nr:hypothetical protein ANANG_G00223480 [Anguilla anguilla]